MKKTILTLTITLYFSFYAIAQQANKTKDSLIEEISEICKQGFINGFSVGVVSKDSILFTEGFGYLDKKNKIPYTEETIQNIASISKTIVGVALLKAQELGILKLDDPINKYLPFNIINPYFPDTEITIRHLATHTSSILDSKKYWNNAYVLKDKRSKSTGKIIGNINNSNKHLPLSKFLKRILYKDGKWYTKKSFNKTKPGELFKYSNIGAALTAYIIEIATEQPFPVFTKTYIFNPLKMDNSGWSFQTINFEKHSKLYANPQKELAPYKLITYPDGGLRTSALDLCKFLKELMKGYQNEGIILSKNSYKELFNKQLTASNFNNRDAENPYNDEYNMGVFMGFSAKGYIGHTGGDPGVASYMFFNPSTNRGRILIVNTELEKEGVSEFSKIWNKLKEF